MQKKQQEQLEQLCKTVEASAKSESGKKDSPEVEQRSSKCTTDIAEQGDEVDFELTPESEAQPEVETTAVVEAAADPPVGTTEADVDQVNAEAVDQINTESVDQVSAEAAEQAHNKHKAEPLTSIWGSGKRQRLSASTERLPATAPESKEIKKEPIAAAASQQAASASKPAEWPRPTRSRPLGKSASCLPIHPSRVNVFPPPAKSLGPLNVPKAFNDLKAGGFLLGASAAGGAADDRARAAKIYLATSWHGWTAHVPKETLPAIKAQQAAQAAQQLPPPPRNPFLNRLLPGDNYKERPTAHAIEAAGVLRSVRDEHRGFLGVSANGRNKARPILNSIAQKHWEDLVRRQISDTSHIKAGKGNYHKILHTHAVSNVREFSRLCALLEVAADEIFAQQ